MLSGFVPALIQRCAPAPEAPAGHQTEIEGVVAFADVSGFTALVETLASRGLEGIEDLSGILSDYFGRFIECTASHGGEVLQIVGDGLVVLWAGDRGGLAPAAMRAVRCGLALQQALHGYAAADAVTLSLKIGIGSGPVRAHFVGDREGRRQFLIAGPALAQMAAAEQRSGPGQVVADPGLATLLADALQYDAIDGGFIRVRAVATAAAPAVPVAPPPPPVLSLEAQERLRSFVPAAVLARLDAGQTDWLAEFRRITVLFLGIGGLDLEAAAGREQFQRLFTTTQDILLRHDGTAVQLRMDDPDIILIAGFGMPPHYREAGAARGLGAAVALHDAVQALGLNCTVGVTSGRVFCGPIGNDRRREYTIHGDVVNLGARLMQAAPPGDVFCDAETRQSGGGELEELPAFVLKGFADPVPVYRLASGRTRADDASLVGRRSECRLLEDRLHQLVTGASGAAAIEGGPGIGKSRLVAYLRDRAETLPVRCLSGTADAIGRSTPYHLWRAVFEQLLEVGRTDGDPEGQRQRVLAQAAADPELARMAPLLSAVMPFELPDNETTAQLSGQLRADNTNRVLAGLLQRAAGDRSLLVVLEDVHWADTASWSLLQLVCERAEPLLLVLTTRPMADPLPAEYERFLGHPQTRRLRLDTLSADSSRELLCRRLGARSVAAEIERVVAHRAEGNPFFIEELARALRDAGMIVVDGGVCRTSDPSRVLDAVPDSIQAAIMSRVGQLDVAQQMTVKVASVIGVSFHRETLADIYPIDTDRGRIRDHLRALERLDLVGRESAGGRSAYAFKHVITQETIYASLPFARRQELHAAVAGWYERAHGDDDARLYPVLAHHWRHAGVGDKAVRYLEKAGEHALQTYANEEAVTFLRQALESTGSDSQDPWGRARSEQQLGEAHVNLRDFAAGRRHLEAGLALLGHRVSATGPGLIRSLVHGALLQLARRSRRRALKVPAGGAPAAQAASLSYEKLVEVYYTAGQPGRSLDAALRALNLAESAGPSPALARAYATVGALCGFVPWRRQAEAYLERALLLADSLEDLPARAWVSIAAAFYHAGTGHWSLANGLLRTGIDAADEVGDQRRRDDGRANLTSVGYLRGQFAPALRRARNLCDTSDRDESRVFGLSAAAYSQLYLGQLEEASASLAEVEQLAAGRQENIDEALETAVLALYSLIHLRQGDLAASLETATRVLEKAAATTPTNYSAFPGYAAAAEVFLALWERGHPVPGIDRLAGKACRVLGRYARIFPIGEPRGHLWRGLRAWLRGRRGRAFRAWNAGLDLARSFPMPYEEALAHTEIGRHLSPDDPARDDHLRRARTVFRRLGATLDVRRVTEELGDDEPG